MTPAQACRDVAYAVANAYARCAEDPAPGEVAFATFRAAWICDLESTDVRGPDRTQVDLFSGLYPSCIAAALDLPCAEVTARAPDDPAWVASCAPRSHTHRACRFFLERLGGRYFNCMAGDATEARRTFLDHWACAAEGPPDAALDQRCAATLEAVACGEVTRRAPQDPAWLAGCEGRFVAQAPPAAPRLDGGLP